MITVIWGLTPFCKALMLLEITPMLLITPPVTKMCMHFVFDYSIRSFKSAPTEVVKTTNKLLISTAPGMFCSLWEEQHCQIFCTCCFPCEFGTPHKLNPQQIDHFQQGHNAHCLPAKLSITIVSKFSWVLQSSKRNWGQWLWKIWGCKQGALWSQWKWWTKKEKVTNEKRRKSEVKQIREKLIFCWRFILGAWDF